MNKSSQIQPPKIPLKFLRWFCDPQLKEDVEGDLTELYYERSGDGWRLAKWLFFLDVVFLFRPGIIKNFNTTQGLISQGMYKNYLKSSWRNLMKHKGFSAINISSLAIGLAACVIIFLFVKDERSFDAWHTKNIYRLCEVQSFTGTNTQKVALSMPGMGPTMTDDFPEIEEYTRFWNWGDQLVELENENIMIENVVGVDSGFFEIFDYPLISGDPSEVVDEPYDGVISETTAIKLFGDTDVIGKTFVIDGDQCIVRGVMKDVPDNSHLQFDIALSIFSVNNEVDEFNSTFRSNFLNTYFVLNENADLANMSGRYPDYLLRNSGRENINDFYKLFLQPLSDVHLASTDIEHDYNNHRKFNGSYIDVFILVGLFILVIASVNFTNLTTARASNRSKEVGVRKTIGAKRKQLFDQFLLESIMLSLMALAIGFVLVLIGLPFLNNIIDRQLSLMTLLEYPVYLLVAVGTALLLGVLAGLYPSLYLSSFKPVVVLKGLKTQEKRSFLRSSLVVLQFSLALGMIVSTLVVVQQLFYIKNKDIGFNKDHIMLVDMNGELREHYQEVKQELLKRSSVRGVTASGQRIGNNFHQWGFKVRQDTGIVGVTPSNVHVDYDYLNVYGIELKQGRNFSKEFAKDDGLAFIINESFAKELGFDEPIGKQAGHSWYPDDSLGTIIGVTEDFNFNSLHYKVNTLSLVVHTEWGYSEMSVKLNGSNIEQGVRDVEEIYGQFVSDFPLKYEFLDDHFDELYKSDQQLGSVVTIIAVLSIFIGCMGLFGLASISIRRRVKEIGIRKVMGASPRELMILLSKEFALMILLSFILASPFTFFFMSGWLENFAYRVSINPLLFVVGGIAALFIALGTISYHVLKAVRLNPVHSLRYE